MDRLCCPMATQSKKDKSPQTHIFDEKSWTGFLESIFKYGITFDFNGPLVGSSSLLGQSGGGIVCIMATKMHILNFFFQSILVIPPLILNSGPTLLDNSSIDMIHVQERSKHAFWKLS